MRGGNIIKSEVSAHIKAYSEAKLSKKAFETDALLFLGADKKRRTLVKLPNILKKRRVAYVARPLGQSRHRKRQRAVGFF